MIQIFGTPKCKDTQKALRFFKERRVEVQFRDLTVKPPSPGELDDMAAALTGSLALTGVHAGKGCEAMLDTECAAAKERGLSYMDYDAREEFLSDPRLYKTPLVREGKGKAARVIAGFDEKALKDML
ncbi:ArsC family transcriptional regulator [Spirochaetia bacterium]|nr:ArsC family transcriptional regulator [Spirochaetia bacterium]